MKKITLLIIAFFAFATLTNAQHYVLIGTAYNGGTNGVGTIFRHDFQTGKDTAIVNFDNTNNGAYPIGTLAVDPNDSLLYGLTTGGGTTGYGVLFSINAATGKDSTRFTYSQYVSGNEPYQGSMTWYNNRFYGLIWAGGPSDSGVIFSFKPATNDDSTLVNFTKTQNTAYYPWGTHLTPYKNGLMYGMTYGDQNYGAPPTYVDSGTIFYYNPVTGKDSVVLILTKQTGYNPEEGELILDKQNGLLYGVNYAGGTADSGTLFSFDPISKAYNVLVNFNKAKGAYPEGDLFYDTLDGKFYGMTYLGGVNDSGALYCYDPMKNKDSVLFSFGNNSGCYPQGNLVLGPGNLFYGFTSEGGTYNNGVLFSFDPKTGKDSVFTNFDGPTLGANPSATPSIVNICPPANILSQPTKAFACVGTDTSFTITTHSANTMSYQWQVNKGAGFTNVTNGGKYTGATTTTLHITKPIMAMNGYKYTITAMDGCSNLFSDTVKLVVDSAIIGLTSSVAKDSICHGDSIKLNGTGGTSYTWTNSVIDGKNFAPTAPQKYVVTGTDAKGCKNKDSVTIVVNPLPVLNVTRKDSVMAGTPDTLVASGACTYLWATGSTKDTNIVSPLVRTTYTVAGTSCYGCSVTDTFSVYIKVITGINNVGNSNKVSVYPNPAAQTLYITTTANTAVPATIKITDVTGKEVMNFTTSLSSTNAIDISDLTAGMYFIKVVTEKNTQTVKFIKN